MASDLSSLSSLSSPPSTDDEMPAPVAPRLKLTPQKSKKKNGTILSFFKSPEPARKKRPASPPHEMAFEDNDDIAVSQRRVGRVHSRRDGALPPGLPPETFANILAQFLVMFRSRFAEAFPPKTPHFGPQDIERGVSELVPSPQIETFLCALLALMLNRKKPIELVSYIFLHVFPGTWSRICVKSPV